ncbi:zinc finger and SCAN domain-containing protein 21 [Copidosoma floridanum]|uniref:zinc finger and SCAN domain-containing protein 21 n=1 Tax=Copidosoma floridanum TaxID=29053 RepID=UPI0006C9BAE8|nr:zinc finger and SCAN domain-containing protein 21 [Copidosoma floridanum]
MELDKKVIEILEKASEGQEIILEQEGDEDGEVVEEIVEIVEELLVEEEENNEDQGETIEQIEREIQEGLQEKQATETTNGEYLQEDTSKVLAGKQVVYASHIIKKEKGVVHYDASADWEDEYEQEEQNNEVENPEDQSAGPEEAYAYESYNNGDVSEIIAADERTRESSYPQGNYDASMNQDNSMSLDGSQHEVVQNAENNLVYTVLSAKKQAKSSEDNISNVEYVQVQRYRNDDAQDDGAIYYTVNDGDGTYVQAIEGEQYQYDESEEPMEQDNQEWEAANQTDEVQQEAEEQDQIFLHEDEDGQLYFKNEHGQLQPVYLTPDGNYAIAENSSDEQESQDDPTQIQEDQQIEADNCVIPEEQPKSFNTKKRGHPDDDDNTVTISLIISEDEHGQKRTQVIIPSPAEAKCNICNKTFKTSLQLLRHNRLKHAREEDITTRNFPCDLCPKRFADQNSLARHRRTHSEGRLFQCLECHESFPTANTLRKHLAIHNPDSLPMPCIYCGRKFLDKASLMKHEQSHLAGEKRTHVCDICQKNFSNLNDLNVHKKNHDPDRKFDCEVCGREFNRLNNLQRHMMVHQQGKQGESEEVLSCNICGITYKFSSSLTRHMVTTHMNPERRRQQAEEQRRKRDNNYRRYMENHNKFEVVSRK